MRIKIDNNFDQVRRQFAHMAKQVDFAAAVALTRTAKDVQSAIPSELDRVLDRPTPFTKRGTYITPAKKTQLEAVVGFKDAQARYMALQIAGGTRDPGRGGIKLPGNIQLNGFGNIPKGTVAKLKAAAKDGSLGTALARRINANGNRRKGAAPLQLFYGQPAGRGWENAPVGIWRRIPPSSPGGKGKLIPIIVFENTTARYRARFDFVGLARRTAAAKFNGHFATELEKAMATAR